MSPSQPVHATVAARWSGAAGGWRGVLLSGASGSGKSDLALRLMAGGWRLVSDDYAWLFASGGRLYARAPEAIEGRIEVRGHGIVGVSSVRLARVVLAVDLMLGAVERLPESATRWVSGVELPLLRVDAREVSACEKVAVASLRL